MILALGCCAGGMRIPAEGAAGGDVALGYASDPISEGQAHATALKAAQAAVGDAGMQRVWTFYDSTCNWLTIRAEPPKLGVPLPAEALRKALAEYRAVRAICETFMESTRTAYARRGGQGPVTELKGVLPELLGGAFSVSGATENGIDLSDRHDANVKTALEAQAQLLGPQSRSASYKPTHRSALVHLQELGLCNLHRPFQPVEVASAAAGAHQPPQPAAPF